MCIGMVSSPVERALNRCEILVGGVSRTLRCMMGLGTCKSQKKIKNPKSFR